MDCRQPPGRRWRRTAMSRLSFQLSSGHRPSVDRVHRKLPAVDWPQCATQSTCRLPAWRRSHASATISGICSPSRRRRKRPRRWSRHSRRRSGASRRSAVLAEILTSLAATSSGQRQRPCWRSRGPCSRRKDNPTASTARSGRRRPPQGPRFAGAWPEGGAPASLGGPACGG